MPATNDGTVTRGLAPPSADRHGAASLAFRGRTVRSVLLGIAVRIERFFVPDELLPSGQVNDRAVQRRYRRMVLTVAGAVVVTFLPSMALAGVPSSLWVPYVASVVVTAGVLSTSLLAVPSSGTAALLAAVVNALAIYWLNTIIGAYYHEAALLFALVVAGQAIIRGIGSALVLVVAGAILEPQTLPVARVLNPTDTVFALVYLLGIAGIVWMYARLQQRGAAAVRAGETKYRELVERVPAIVYTADFGPAGRWRYVSPQVERLLGYPAEAWTADPGFWLQHVHPDDRARVLEDEEASSMLPPGPGGMIEYRMVGRDGRVRWVRDESAVIAAVEGSPAHWSGFLVDITQQKELEELLRQAQRMEAVGQLAGGIAHDFNNLLTAIRGYGELALTDLAPDSGSRADVEEMLRAADRAASLTRQLLAFSRRQVLRPEVLAPAAIIDGLAPMLSRLLGEHIELVTTHAPQVGRIRVDQSQLEQVIINLAVNARDAMPGGGRLVIETSSVASGGEASPDGAPPLATHCRITVADTGSGMDETTRARIYEPFFTTKGIGKGTGMGLATVYGIVEQSGGRISCTSEPGRGTTFAIDLPLVESATASHAPDGERRATRGSETILLVEDEGTVRTIARRVLDGLGYTVLEASSGPEALQRAAAYAGPIDLLLTDVLMPQMQGPELADRLRAARPGLRVLLMSGFPGERRQDAADRPAAAGLLAKPFDAYTLGAAVRAALNEPTSSSEPAASSETAA